MNAGPKPSCSTCPAFLGSQREVHDKLGKATGSPMCGRYGTALNKPTFLGEIQTRRLQEYKASACDSYGEPMPAAPVKRDAYVAMPDPTAMVESEEGPRKASCSSCAMCKNYVRDDAVAREFGWTTGMCAARGKLILPNRQAIEARGCEYREVGPVRTSTTGIRLLPEYTDGFGDVNPVAVVLAARELSVDPQEYVTDREVTAEEALDGIRAWRRVSDTAGEHHTFLPIYDIEHFKDEERDLIPKSGDDEHPELYVDHFEGVYTAAVCWTEVDETPALWGVAGTGKTELGRHMAWLMGMPFRRISITGSTELDDLAGKMHYSPEEGTFFQYGRLPQAWGKPGIIVIDEPNTGPADVWQFLRPLTDNSKQLILDQNKGEVLKRHTDAYLMMAMNPAWDPLNVGTMQIGDADANRLMHIEVPMPPRELEEEIIRQRVSLDGWEISPVTLGMVMSIAQDIRALVEQGTIPISWAIRPQIKVARALRWFEPVTAYRRAVADYLEPESREAILDVVRSHV